MIADEDGLATVSPRLTGQRLEAKIVEVTCRHGGRTYHIAVVPLGRCCTTEELHALARALLEVAPDVSDIGFYQDGSALVFGLYPNRDTRAVATMVVNLLGELALQRYFPTLRRMTPTSADVIGNLAASVLGALGEPRNTLVAFAHSP